MGGLSLTQLNECIDNFNETINFQLNMNKKLKRKKIRLSNFPSHVSENIVKFVIKHVYGFMPKWDIKCGDLSIGHLRIEVKGSLNLENGPSSFGPSEKWNIIYFVDGTENHLKKYKVYEINLSNKSEEWKNIRVNKTQTFYDQCIQKRRPRINFKKIQDQVECRLIFHDYLSTLE